MAKRRVGHFDRETGEVLDGSIVAFIPRKRKNGFRTGWFSMSLDAHQVILNAGLTGADFRVLHTLMSNVDYENKINMTQADAGEALGMSRTHVNKAFKKLEKAEVIKVYRRIGPVNLYRFNPELMWRGTADQHITSLEAERAKRLKDGMPR